MVVCLLKRDTLLMLSVILISRVLWIPIIRNTEPPASSFADRQADTVEDTTPPTEAVALLVIYAPDFFALTAAVSAWAEILLLAAKREKTCRTEIIRPIQRD